MTGDSDEDFQPNTSDNDVESEKEDLFLKKSNFIHISTI